MAIGTTAAIIISLVATAAAAGVSAYSAHQQGQAQKKAAEFNKQVAENNAKLASMQARYDTERLREKNRRLAAKQRVSFAKSGVSIVSGSAFDVLQDQEIQGELDELALLYRGNVQATGYQGQAQYQQFVGEQAEIQGRINTISAGVGGAADIAGTAAYASTLKSPDTTTKSVSSRPTASFLDAPSGYGQQPRMEV